MQTQARTPRDAMMAAMAAATLILEASLLGGCAGTSGGGTQVAVLADDQTPIAATVQPASRNYGFWEKQVFIADMEAELESISRDIERVFPAVEHAGTIIPGIDGMRALAATQYRLLEEARTATEQEWPVLTSRFAKGLAELQDVLERSRQKISESVDR